MEEEIARRFACAFISYQLGIGFDYAMKRYLKDQPPGEMWRALARMVIHAQSAQQTITDTTKDHQ